MCCVDVYIVFSSFIHRQWVPHIHFKNIAPKTTTRLSEFSNSLKEVLPLELVFLRPVFLTKLRLVLPLPSQIQVFVLNKGLRKCVVYNYASYRNVLASIHVLDASI